MLRSKVAAALLSAALMTSASAALAQETVVWWDFFTGGDGIRMKTLIDTFNAEHEGKIKIEATTLEGGTTFYTKVQTSAAINEGPDMMSYHLSRLPVSLQNGTLAEITAEDLAAAGLATSDYEASNITAASSDDGKLYAIPFDMHPVVLYYNKDLLAKAGLIGADGLPTGLDGIDNFNAALKKIQEAGAQYGMANFTANGDFQSRTIYSLLGQQDTNVIVDGEVLPNGGTEKLAKALDLMGSWVTNGYIPAMTDYGAAIGLFTTGQAGLHINGVWEVPSFTDLAAQNKLGFDWGAIELPVFFDHPSTYADSHAFAIPNNVGRIVTPEKRAAVMQVIGWMAKHSLVWATAGHIPAYKPVTASAEYKALQPQATYAKLAANVIFDSKSPLAGNASPVQEAAGNDFTDAVNGAEDATTAAERFRDDVQGLL